MSFLQSRMCVCNLNYEAFSRRLTPGNVIAPEMCRDVLFENNAFDSNVLLLFQEGVFYVMGPTVTLKI